MSHWMTSGRSRLKAKQNRGFAHRATQRARVIAPETMQFRGKTVRQPSENEKHPNVVRRSGGGESRLSRLFCLL